MMGDATIGGWLQPGLTLGAVPAEAWAFGGACAAVALVVGFALKCFKSVPQNQIMVVYGNVGKGLSHRCYVGGLVFVRPLTQDFACISLEPYELAVHRATFTSKDGGEIVFHGTFTAGVSTDPVLMDNAAERLLNLPRGAIREQLEEVLAWELETTIGGLDTGTIDARRESLVGLLTKRVDEQFNKLGVRLINLRIDWIEHQPT